MRNVFFHERRLLHFAPETRKDINKKFNELANVSKDFLDELNQDPSTANVDALKTKITEMGDRFNKSTAEINKLVSEIDTLYNEAKAGSKDRKNVGMLITTQLRRLFKSASKDSRLDLKKLEEGFRNLEHAYSSASPKPGDSIDDLIKQAFNPDPPKAKSGKSRADEGYDKIRDQAAKKEQVDNRPLNDRIKELRYKVNQYRIHRKNILKKYGPHRKDLTVRQRAIAKATEMSQIRHSGMSDERELAKLRQQYIAQNGGGKAGLEAYDTLVRTQGVYTERGRISFAEFKASEPKTEADALKQLARGTEFRYPGDDDVEVTLSDGSTIRVGRKWKRVVGPHAGQVLSQRGIVGSDRSPSHFRWTTRAYRRDVDSPKLRRSRRRGSEATDSPSYDFNAPAAGTRGPVDTYGAPGSGRTEPAEKPENIREIERAARDLSAATRKVERARARERVRQHQRNKELRNRQEIFHSILQEAKKELASKHGITSNQVNSVVKENSVQITYRKPGTNPDSGWQPEIYFDWNEDGGHIANVLKIVKTTGGPGGRKVEHKAEPVTGYENERLTWDTILELFEEVHGLAQRRPERDRKEEFFRNQAEKMRQDFAPEMEYLNSAIAHTTFRSGWSVVHNNTTLATEFRPEQNMVTFTIYDASNNTQKLSFFFNWDSRSLTSWEVVTDQGSTTGALRRIDEGVFTPKQGSLSGKNLHELIVKRYGDKAATDAQIDRIRQEREREAQEQRKRNATPKTPTTPTTPSTPSTPSKTVDTPPEVSALVGPIRQRFSKFVHKTDGSPIHSKDPDVRALGNALVVTVELVFSYPVEITVERGANGKIETVRRVDIITPHPLGPNRGDPPTRKPVSIDATAVDAYKKNSFDEDGIINVFKSMFNAKEDAASTPATPKNTVDTPPEVTKLAADLLPRVKSLKDKAGGEDALIARAAKVEAKGNSLVISGGHFDIAEEVTITRKDDGTIGTVTRVQIKHDPFGGPSSKPQRTPVPLKDDDFDFPPPRLRRFNADKILSVLTEMFDVEEEGAAPAPTPAETAKKQLEAIATMLTPAIRALKTAEGKDIIPLQRATLTAKDGNTLVLDKDGGGKNTITITRGPLGKVENVVGANDPGDPFNIWPSYTAVITDENRDRWTKLDFSPENVQQIIEDIFVPKADPTKPPDAKEAKEVDEAAVVIELNTKLPAISGKYEAVASLEDKTIVIRVTEDNPFGGTLLAHKYIFSHFKESKLMSIAISENHEGQKNLTVHGGTVFDADTILDMIKPTMEELVRDGVKAWIKEDENNKPKPTIDKAAVIAALTNDPVLGNQIEKMVPGYKGSVEDQGGDFLVVNFVEDSPKQQKHVYVFTYMYDPGTGKISKAVLENLYEKREWARKDITATDTPFTAQNILEITKKNMDKIVKPKPAVDIAAVLESLNNDPFKGNRIEKLVTGYKGVAENAEKNKIRISFDEVSSMNPQSFIFVFEREDDGTIGFSFLETDKRGEDRMQVKISIPADTPFHPDRILNIVKTEMDKHVKPAPPNAIEQAQLDTLGADMTKELQKEIDDLKEATPALKPFSISISSSAYNSTKNPGEVRWLHHMRAEHEEYEKGRFGLDVRLWKDKGNDEMMLDVGEIQLESRDGTPAQDLISVDDLIESLPILIPGRFPRPTVISIGDLSAVDIAEEVENGISDEYEVTLSTAHGLAGTIQVYLKGSKPENKDERIRFWCHSNPVDGTDKHESRIVQVLRDPDSTKWSDITNFVTRDHKKPLIDQMKEILGEVEPGMPAAKLENVPKEITDQIGENGEKVEALFDGNASTRVVDKTTGRVTWTGDIGGTEHEIAVDSNAMGNKAFLIVKPNALEFTKFAQLASWVGKPLPQPPPQPPNQPDPAPPEDPLERQKLMRKWGSELLEYLNAPNGEWPEDTYIAYRIGLSIPAFDDEQATIDLTLWNPNSTKSMSVVLVGKKDAADTTYTISSMKWSDRNAGDLPLPDAVNTGYTNKEFLPEHIEAFIKHPELFNGFNKKEELDPDTFEGKLGIAIRDAGYEGYTLQFDDSALENVTLTVTHGTARCVLKFGVLPAFGREPSYQTLDVLFERGNTVHVLSDEARGTVVGKVITPENIVEVIIANEHLFNDDGKSEAQKALEAQIELRLEEARTFWVADALVLKGHAESKLKAEGYAGYIIAPGFPEFSEQSAKVEFNIHNPGKAPGKVITLRTYAERIDDNAEYVVEELSWSGKGAELVEAKYLDRTVDSDLVLELVENSFLFDSLGKGEKPAAPPEFMQGEATKEKVEDQLDHMETELEAAGVPVRSVFLWNDVVYADPQALRESVPRVKAAIMGLGDEHKKALEQTRIGLGNEEAKPYMNIQDDDERIVSIPYTQTEAEMIASLTPLLDRILARQRVIDELNALEAEVGAKQISIFGNFVYDYVELEKAIPTLRTILTNLTDERTEALKHIPIIFTRAGQALGLNNSALSSGNRSITILHTQSEDEMKTTIESGLDKVHARTLAEAEVQKLHDENLAKKVALWNNREYDYAAVIQSIPALRAALRAVPDADKETVQKSIEIFYVPPSTRPGIVETTYGNVKRRTIGIHPLADVDAMKAQVEPAIKEMLDYENLKVALEEIKEEYEMRHFIIWSNLEYDSQSVLQALPQVKAVLSELTNEQKGKLKGKSFVMERSIAYTDARTNSAGDPFTGLHFAQTKEEMRDTILRGLGELGPVDDAVRQKDWQAMNAIGEEDYFSTSTENGHAAIRHSLQTSKNGRLISLKTYGYAAPTCKFIIMNDSFVEVSLNSIAAKHSPEIKTILTDVYKNRPAATPENAKKIASDILAKLEASTKLTSDEAIVATFAEDNDLRLMIRRGKPGVYRYLFGSDVLEISNDKKFGTKNLTGYLIVENGKIDSVYVNEDHEKLPAAVQTLLTQIQTTKPEANLVNAKKAFTDVLTALESTASVTSDERSVATISQSSSWDHHIYENERTAFRWLFGSDEIKKYCEKQYAEDDPQVNLIVKDGRIVELVFHERDAEHCDAVKAVIETVARNTPVPSLEAANKIYELLEKALKAEAQK